MIKLTKFTIIAGLLSATFATSALASPSISTAQAQAAPGLNQFNFPQINSNSGVSSSYASATQNNFDTGYATANVSSNSTFNTTGVTDLGTLTAKSIGVAQATASTTLYQSYVNQSGASQTLQSTFSVINEQANLFLANSTPSSDVTIGYKIDVLVNGLSVLNTTSYAQYANGTYTSSLGGFSYASSPYNGYSGGTYIYQSAPPLDTVISLGTFANNARAQIEYDLTAFVISNDPAGYAFNSMPGFLCGISSNYSCADGGDINLFYQLTAPSAIVNKAIAMTSAVPEADSWLLLLAGVAMVGGMTAMRRLRISKPLLAGKRAAAPPLQLA